MNEEVKILLQGYLDQAKADFLQKYDAEYKSSGKLGQSLDTLIIENQGKFVGTFTGNDYVHELINGRRPGKQPPVQALIDWVNQKGIASGKKADSIGYAIAKSIGEEGTEPNPDLLMTIPTPDNLYKSVGKTILDGMVDNIKKIYE